MSDRDGMALIGVRDGGWATAVLLLDHATRSEIREFEREMAATGRTVETVTVGEMRDRLSATRSRAHREDRYVLAVDVTEALDAIDRYAGRDMDHELHAIVEHYRDALGVRP